MAKEHNISESLTSAKSMDHVLLYHCKRTADRKSLDIKFSYCKSSYQIRKVRNKGALIVLIWNYLATTLFYFLASHVPKFDHRPYFIVCCFTLPTAGWLADVYLGRYKVIRWSMWIMWTAAVLATVSSVAEQMTNSYHHVHTYVVLVLFTIASIGLGTFWANVIQFGLDQLQDASTTEITAFISWFMWTSMSGGIVIDFAYTCINQKYHIIGQLYACICLTMMLILLFSSNNVLIKEPVTLNPFKLVYKVVKFAIKHKHPRCRSAFTYCEDELPSRLDLGKSKYGGPFTTEQVEDVKTFLRLLMIVFFGCAVPSALLVANSLRNKFIKTLMNSNQVFMPTFQCFLNSLYTHGPFYSVVVLVPLYELIVRPMLYKYLLWVQCYWTFSLGVILQFVRIMLLMSYVLIARHSYIARHHGHNATIQCIFFVEYGTLGSSFDIRWIALQGFLNSVSVFTLGLGGVEFICAQTPYTMRGLISGAGYGSVTLFTLVGIAITKPFTMDLPVWNNSGGIVSCGFWYSLLIIVFFIFNGAILCILGRVYKNRKREDVLPNEQIFAERYYTEQ